MHELRVFRFVLAIGVIGLLGGGYFIDVARDSVLIERYVFAPIMILLWAGTFFIDTFRKHVEWIALACLLLALWIFCVFLYETQLNVLGAVSCFALGFVGCLALRSQLQLSLWCFLSTVCMSVTAQLIETPEMERSVFVISLVVITVGTGALVHTLASTIRARNESDLLSDTVFSQSADALLYGHVSTAKVLRANKSAETLFETTDWDELVRCLQQSFIAAHPDQPTATLLKQAVQGLWSSELECETARGKRFWAHLSIVRLKEHSDMILVRVADMSEAKAREQELEEARLAAETAMRARTQFLANMSHEIRTPMNGVIGMTSLLQNTSLTSEQTSYVDTIRSSGESLLLIINEILDFAKIEANEIELEIFPFDLERCIADAVDVIATLAAQKDLELALHIKPEDIGDVSGDGARLRQVLVNLLANAVKFTDRGQISIEVTVDKAADRQAPSTIRFAITDSGIGIPADKIVNLFEPFTQADASTTRRYGGTGLGLSICKNLVELMGGEISATSIEGQGSTFSFSIKAPWRARKVWDDLPGLQGKRILAVDDNLTNREVLRGLLDWFGTELTLYATPLELLGAYQPGCCDLILTDMSMPDMDGEALLNELKTRDAELPPVLLLTSLDRGDVNWNQFAQVLRKPIRPTELFNALTRALDNTLQLGQAAQDDRMLSLTDEVVLVAEDNVVNQTVARQILKKLGLRADIASDGAEAVAMLNRQPYKMVFMDVQMPQVDGLEATRLIRANQDLPQPYIVAMTANAMNEDRDACLSVGMDDFVPKPVSMTDIKAALQRAIDGGALSAKE